MPVYPLFVQGHYLVKEEQQQVVDLSDKVSTFGTLGRGTTVLLLIFHLSGNIPNLREQLYKCLSCIFSVELERVCFNCRAFRFWMPEDFEVSISLIRRSVSSSLIFC